MNTRSSDLKIPDWKLERYLLEELPAEELERVELEAKRSGSLRARLDALEQSNREINRQYPPGWVCRQIEEKLDKRTPVTPVRNGDVFSRFWPLPALAVVLLLIAVLPRVFVTGSGEPGDAGMDAEIRYKGFLPTLQIFRKTDTGAERLEDGSLAREHDLIQIRYQAAERAYGVILSTDGRGEITLHLPYEGARSARLKRGQPDTLDFAYELDDAPRWERFYFITSDVPFAVDTVVQAVRRKFSQDPTVKGDSLRVPDGFGQFIFTLRKETSDE